jgi:Uma2 family endonuclease
MPLFAPQDLKLDLNKKHDTVVQPDIMVKCGKPTKYMPLLVVEVLSPSTKDRDKGIKLQLYRENGVLEYWIVNPDDETITVHDFVSADTFVYENGKDEFIAPIIFPDCIMNIAQIFDYYYEE